ncbi:NAD(P)H-binding protein [Spirillospora sp. NPDC047279]|uniref:NmrA family NAD(P)-binding protein n=1 Tax=Spirillospora sp. NPDC047279 TaxID=3155478 RepID=UPI00340D3006
MDPVLVTGAAGGSQGSTGRLVAQALLERGHAVRAFVRADDDRAARLRALGAEVVVGDLREIADVLPAFGGVRRAFFTYPVTEGLLEAAAAFAAAARRAGVERLVEVSQLAAEPDANTHRMRQHWLAEQVFDGAGVGAVHLRAAVFFENLDVLIRLSGRNVLAAPLGDPGTLVPLVAGADVARVAAGLLDDPALKPDPVCRLTGEMLTAGEAAAAFGVPYVDVPPDEWHRDALRAYGDPDTVRHLSKLWEIFRFLGPNDHPLYRVTPAIEEYGGRPPLTLRAYASSR